jgi:hypothetical protein
LTRLFSPGSQTKLPTHITSSETVSRPIQSGNLCSETTSAYFTARDSILVREPGSHERFLEAMQLSQLEEPFLNLQSLLKMHELKCRNITKSPVNGDRESKAPDSLLKDLTLPWECKNWVSHWYLDYDFLERLNSTKRQRQIILIDLLYSYTDNPFWNEDTFRTPFRPKEEVMTPSPALSFLDAVSELYALALSCFLKHWVIPLGMRYLQQAPLFQRVGDILLNWSLTAHRCLGQNSKNLEPLPGNPEDKIRLLHDAIGVLNWVHNPVLKNGVLTGK